MKYFHRLFLKSVSLVVDDNISPLTPGPATPGSDHMSTTENSWWCSDEEILRQFMVMIRGGSVSGEHFRKLFESFHSVIICTEDAHVFKTLLPCSLQVSA